MNWELYEVWGVSEEGHEDLIETTKSLKEAKQLAQTTLEENEELVECVIYQEDEAGDLIEIETILGG